MASRLTHKKQKMTRSVSSTHQQSDLEDTLDFAVVENTPFTMSNSPSGEHQAIAGDMLWSELEIDDFLDSDLSPRDLSEDLWGITASNIHSNVLHTTTSILAQSTVAAAPGVLPVVQTQRPRLPPIDEIVIGFWHGSPIQLLNSSVTSYLLNACLRAVYDTMMTGIASRYLAYGCNAFAGAHKYVFGTDVLLSPTMDQADQHTLVTGNPHCLSTASESFLDISQPVTSSESHNSAVQRVDKAKKVTLIGVVRFLDNFGDLYGNSIDKTTRKQDESALTAVLQAFTLQWLLCVEGSTTTASSCCLFPTGISPEDNHIHDSSPDTASMRFSTAWFNAHSHLTNTKNNCSFLHLYVLFLFHMTAVPSEAISNTNAGEDPDELLQHGLHQLTKLQNLVESYCENLDHNSIYWNLLKSSTKIIQWYGYVRDTVASMVSGRPCVLQAARKGAHSAFTPTRSQISLALITRSRAKLLTHYRRMADWMGAKRSDS